MRDLTSILDLKRNEISLLFETAERIEKEKLHKRGWPILRGKTVTLAFFEPSTRTRLSFELASKKLGAETLSVVGEEATSMKKGETFHDTIRIFDILSDAIVLRHQRDGAAKYAAEIAEAPVINAGDGKNQHPTQTLTDLYVITKKKGSIDGLSIAVVGDVRYARTARSFLLGLTLFKPKSVYIVTPPALRPPLEFLEELRERGLTIYESEDLESVINMVDVLYVTRIQKERFPDITEYEKVKGSYRVTLELLQRGKEDLIVLHPLPRVDELDLRIDKTQHAAYFDQVRATVPIRMATLAWCMGALQ